MVEVAVDVMVALMALNQIARTVISSFQAKTQFQRVLFLILKKILKVEHLARSHWIRNYFYYI